MTDEIKIRLTFADPQESPESWIYTDKGKTRYPASKAQYDGVPLLFLINRTHSSIGFYKNEGIILTCLIEKELPVSKINMLCEGKPVDLQVSSKMFSYLSKLSEQEKAITLETISNTDKPLN